MRTIDYISEAIGQMQKFNIPAQIKIGTFAVNSSGSLYNWAGYNGKFETAEITFELECTTKHLQYLLDRGIRIDLTSIHNKVGRPNGNQITTTAAATLSALQSIRKYCRFNHLNHVSIDNWHNLQQAGWKQKEKPIAQMSVEVREHFNRIEAIRKEVRKKFKRELNNYTAACAVKRSSMQ